jgi:alginate O-acetyltransferase complex protein AlgI
MVFSSVLFLFCFLPIFLILYYLTPVKLRNYTALLGSLLFYAWGAPQFVAVLISTISIDFILARAIGNPKQQRRRALLILSVVVNVGFLVYCKYANFFIDNVNLLTDALGAGSMKWIEVALPIGISFFTFQKLSYIIDVYRGTHRPLNNIADYALYVILFPQLIAGPIVRYHEIADQLVDRAAQENIDNRLQGLFRFIIGLAKKVLIANVLGEVADNIFNAGVENIDSVHAWIGALAYTFQIYFDFSGYSDMAIGLGRMMGFKFPENFNFPYVARNITDFWRRWHITLGRWMRDYLYIPLGGNRVSTNRLYINLCIVFVLSGFWHGAAWTFIVWGAYHGTFLVLDRIFLKGLTDSMGKVPSIALTFFLAMIGWVLFRSPSIEFAVDYIYQMFSFTGGQEMIIAPKFWYIFAFAALFSFMGAITPLDRLLKKDAWVVKNPINLTVVAVFCMLVLAVCAANIVTGGFNPFIYFRF